ncbi:MAG: hypothetical protein AAB955_02690 [Patescibacteria group bacterium]
MAEEPPLTKQEMEAATRFVIRCLTLVAGVYLALQVAHEYEFLPDFIDFGSFESPWWRFALIVFGAGLVTGGRGKRGGTTPNP